MTISTTTAAQVPTTPSRWHGIGLRRERWYGYYFLGPSIFLIAVLIVTPLVRAMWTSLYRTRGLRSEFVGLENYVKLFSTSEFWESLRISVSFTAISVSIQMVLGLALALALHRVVFGRTLLRVGFLAPWIVAPSIGAVIWVWLLDPQFGVINHLLLNAGVIDEAKAWLADPNLAFVSIIVVDVWRGTPFVLLLLLAGLQGIPKEQYEAAEVDGATFFQQLRFVTIPNLRYLLVVVSTLNIINTMRHFDIVAIMTGGGPVGATEVLPVLIYNTAFTQNRFGQASAIGIVLLGIILIFAIFYLRALEPGKARDN